MYMKYTFAVVDSTILFIALKVIVFYESINCKLMAPLDKIIGNYAHFLLIE